MKKLALVCAIFSLVSCSSEGDATRALEGAGYTNIKIEGYRIFGCAKSDEFHTGFTAVGPTGKAVSGVVCSGWLKGATIRTD